LHNKEFSINGNDIISFGGNSELNKLFNPVYIKHFLSTVLELQILISIARGSQTSAHMPQEIHSLEFNLSVYIIFFL